MQNIKFLKEPGFVFDLLFLFTLHFNKNYCLANFINQNKSAEDTEYYNRLLKDHSAIPKELFLFFYIGDKKVNFISKYAYRPSFRPKNGKLDTSFTLRTMLGLLTDHEKVTEAIIEFYFPQATEGEKEECKSSIIAADRLIRNSSYSGNLKSSLYSYFISPIATIQALSYELMFKESQLAQQYEATRQSFLALQNDLDFGELAQELVDGNHNKTDITSFQNIYLSFCLNNKNCIKLFYYQNECLVILGVDYKAVLTFLTTQDTPPDLEKFGTAVSERNRVDILNFMKKRGEITIKDVEREFNLTGTNAYYHLSTMTKAGVVKTRNQGRTVLYSIDKDHFRTLCDLLITYSKE